MLHLLFGDECKCSYKMFEQTVLLKVSSQTHRLTEVQMQWWTFQPLNTVALSARLCLSKVK